MEELRKITKKEFVDILEQHLTWLRTGQEEGMKANLRSVSLNGLNLSELNLSGADLTDAYLIGTDLRNTNLAGACLWMAHLQNADLKMANLSHADLRGADMRKANLNETSLYKAVLRNANLTGATLMNTNLAGSDLRYAKYFVPSVCPVDGAFIAWKKAMVTPCGGDFVIIKLLIPEEALRSSGTSRKCRASKAVVLDIQTLDGESLKGVTACSWYIDGFVYRVGDTVEPDVFDGYRFNECSHGIHFFVERQEAVNYEF